MIITILETNNRTASGCTCVYKPTLYGSVCKECNDCYMFKMYHYVDAIMGCFVNNNNNNNLNLIMKRRNSYNSARDLP